MASATDITSAIEGFITSSGLAHVATTPVDVIEFPDRLSIMVNAARDTRPEDADAFITPERRFMLCFRRIGDYLINKLGYDVSVEVGSNITHRVQHTRTPEAFTEAAMSRFKRMVTLNRLTTNIICKLPQTVVEAMDGLTPYDRTRYYLMDYLHAAAAKRKLFMTHEVMLHREDENVIECEIKILRHKNDDGLAPLKARVYSFASRLKELLDELQQKHGAKKFELFSNHKGAMLADASSQEVVNNFKFSYDLLTDNDAYAATTTFLINFHEDK